MPLSPTDEVAKNTRIKHAAESKAKVGAGGCSRGAMVPELAKGLGVHPNQIYKWKREFIENAARAFSNGEATKSLTEAHTGIGRYLVFDNEQRPHEALGYQTPAAFHRGPNQRAG